MTADELESTITTSNAENTRIMSISVENEDPELAKEIADALREAASVKIQDIMEIDAVNTIDEASMPQEPSSPSVMRNTMLGGVLGAILAIGVIALIFILDDTIKTPDDVEYYLGLNVLTSIPLREGEAMREIVLKDIVRDYRSNEAYKTLRTNIEFSGSDNKAIVLTSSTPNEGKSTVSLGLAVALAESGKNVLLIDADLRKSVLMGRYRVSGVVKGLSHFLSGQAEIEDTICKTQIGHLHMIFADDEPPVRYRLRCRPVRKRAGK